MLENRRTSLKAVQCVLLVLVLSLTLAAAIRPVFTTPATDPGVRGGPAGAGGRLAGVTTKEGKFFDAGLDEFNEVQSPTGSASGTEAGLGPRFNLDSCAGCHAHPAVGGTSPATNPQVTRQPFMAPGNTLPSPFITLNGPVREARSKSEGGGVHDLFVITGRPDAGTCNIPQLQPFPSDVVFRIPTPVFGAGLIEAITDATILANKGAKPLGISGHENREGNTGTITRFGWKAQNKSLAIFAGEAYNVEQGVTNELFPQERDETPGCLLNPTPEDKTNYEETQPQKISSNVMSFANFMLFLAPPTPVTSYTRTVAPIEPVGTGSINHGSLLFASTTVGCALCHTPSLTTGTNSSAVLSVKTANLFSDLLVHHMGTGLADGITQGAAGEDEFRTAPLWGLGQRIFFLHDGRSTDLFDVIQQHSSAGSEATGSVGAFNALSNGDQQDILNFLRSL